MGLVKQVLASRPMRTIQRLTQTYVTLSLADIAKAAGLKTADEAEAMILKWVGLGDGGVSPAAVVSNALQLSGGATVCVSQRVRIQLGVHDSRGVCCGVGCCATAGWCRASRCLRRSTGATTWSPSCR